MTSVIEIPRYIAAFASSPLSRWGDSPPWLLTSDAASIVRELLAGLPTTEFDVKGDVAIHRTAEVEAGVVLKGPLVLGAGCLVAAGAYLRGGNWVAERCIVGPGSELKSSFVFADTKLAHFNFVGDSVLGANVNLEAGSIVCNFRNERPAKEILVRVGSELHRTGVEKFGALIGDGTRIGANAVIAPGAVLPARTVVGRAELCDQERPPSLPL